MRHCFRLVLVPLLLVALGAALAPRARAADRCFAETGQCLTGRFERYWLENGGLPVFGFPVAAARDEFNRDTGRTYLTQWLERNRFELHPENAAPYDVLLGRLGDDRLRQQGRDWQTLPKASPSAAHYFAQTGHAVAHAPFWQYWSSHGLELGDRGVSERESLALWGLPLSEPQIETNASGDTVLTQWFERARFEDHGANGVLLGLLGTEVRAGSALPGYPALPGGLVSGEVVNVVDGDTVDVRIGGAVERLRLIGIDTPETVDPRKPVQCFGREASARAHALLDGRSVQLEADPSQDERDRYGRLLRYVWLPDGTLFNLEMVAGGYAHEYTYATPYRYQAIFREAERRAREQGLGLWSPLTCGGDTEQPAPAPQPTPMPQPTAAPPRGNCDPAYPTVCIPSPPPDLDCGQIAYRNFRVLPPDPHRFDGNRDGIGCES